MFLRSEFADLLLDLFSSGCFLQHFFLLVYFFIYWLEDILGDSGYFYQST
jgi:hypothetical protein